LADALRERFGADVTLDRGDSGVYDVVVDGELASRGRYDLSVEIL